MRPWVAESYVYRCGRPLWRTRYSYLRCTQNFLRSRREAKRRMRAYYERRIWLYGLHEGEPTAIDYLLRYSAGLLHVKRTTLWKLSYHFESSSTQENAMKQIAM